MVHVKVCGLTRPDDFRAARDADAVGVVVESPRSHRNVDLERARELFAFAAPFQSRVAVTAAHNHDVLAHILATVRPDALQAPSATTAETLKRLRNAFPAARLVVSARAENVASLPLDLVDAVVVDALTADGYGGSGELADWARARPLAADLPRPVVLAGGLGPGNVADAVRAVRPYGVDASSGLEGPDKLKDPARVRAFVANAHAAGVEVDSP